MLFIARLLQRSLGDRFEGRIRPRGKTKHDSRKAQRKSDNQYQYVVGKHHCRRVQPDKPS